MRLQLSACDTGSALDSSGAADGKAGFSPQRGHKFVDKYAHN